MQSNSEYIIEKLRDCMDEMTAYDIFSKYFEFTNIDLILENYDYYNNNRGKVRNMISQDKNMSIFTPPEIYNITNALCNLIFDNGIYWTANMMTQQSSLEYKRNSSHLDDKDCTQKKIKLTTNPQNCYNQPDLHMHFDKKISLNNTQHNSWTERIKIEQSHDIERFF